MWSDKINKISKEIIKVNNGDIVDLSSLVHELLMCIHYEDEMFFVFLKKHIVSIDMSLLSILNSIITIILNHQPGVISIDGKTSVITLTPILIPVTLAKKNDYDEIELDHFTWSPFLLDHMCNKLGLCEILGIDEDDDIYWSKHLISHETFSNVTLKKQLSKSFDLISGETVTRNIKRIKKEHLMTTGFLWGVCIQKSQNGSNEIKYTIDDNLRYIKQQNEWRSKMSDLITRNLNSNKLELNAIIGPTCLFVRGVTNINAFAKEAFFQKVIEDNRFEELENIIVKINTNPETSYISILIYKDNYSVLAYNYGKEILGYNKEDENSLDVDLLVYALNRHNITNIIYSSDVIDFSKNSSVLDQPLMSIV